MLESFTKRLHRKKVPVKDTDNLSKMIENCLTQYSSHNIIQVKLLCKYDFSEWCPGLLPPSLTRNSRMQPEWLPPQKPPSSVHQAKRKRTLTTTIACYLQSEFHRFIKFEGKSLYGLHMEGFSKGRRRRRTEDPVTQLGPFIFLCRCRGVIIIMRWDGLAFGLIGSGLQIVCSGEPKKAPGAERSGANGGAASLPPVENRLELIIGMIIRRRTTSSTAARIGARRTLTWTAKISLYSASNTSKL